MPKAEGPALVAGAISTLSSQWKHVTAADLKTLQQLISHTKSAHKEAAKAAMPKLGDSYVVKAGPKPAVGQTGTVIANGTTRCWVVSTSTGAASLRSLQRPARRV